VADLDLAVDRNADDGYSSGTIGFLATATQLYCGNVAGGSTDSWMVFRGATGLQGKTIASATLTLTRNAAGSGTCAWKCRGMAADNVTPPTDITTYNALSWTAASTTGSSSSPATLAIDVTAIVQELANRAGFANDKIGFQVADNGSASFNYMENAAFDATPQEPRLSITFAASGGPFPHYTRRLLTGGMPVGGGLC
jgi:hypothetical protein